jgi:Ca2+-binding RTX toxin-like protein
VEKLTGSARNDMLDAQEGAGNDTADGGTGTDTCQTDTGDRRRN